CGWPSASPGTGRLPCAPPRSSSAPRTPTLPRPRSCRPRCSLRCSAARTPARGRPLSSSAVTRCGPAAELGEPATRLTLLPAPGVQQGLLAHGGHQRAVAVEDVPGGEAAG